MSKYIAFVFCFLMSGVMVYAQPDYYWYRGEKIDLTINKERVVMYYEDGTATMRNSDITGLAAERNVYSGTNNQSNSHLKKISATEFKLDKAVDYDALLNTLQKRPDVKAIEPVIGYEYPVMVSNIFYVKIKNAADFTDLERISRETNTNILYEVPYCDLWYALETTKNSVSNSIGASNLFYESGLFEDVDPGFLFDFKPEENCVTDAFFGDQWNMFFINACPAWEVTRGNSSVKIAIIDKGVNKNHIDFSGVNFCAEYDAVTNTEGVSYVYGEHGTHVCGIASANHNYAKVAGVAPGANVMIVSHDLVGNRTTSAQELASGIRWAVEKGADVLNNSWGDKGGMTNNLHSAILEDAIDYALDSGRGGKGCVVVFCAGNNAPQMDYPAIYRDEILTVGAYTDLNMRAPFSAYGSKLDLVAPGYQVLSTIYSNTSDWITESGTSMAAPHAAGVAALVLSLHPQYSGQEVVNILECTANKIGGYNYLDSNGRPNGTWNNEMGYGGLDAYKAVAPAIDIINDNKNYPEQINGNIQKLAREKISLKDGFRFKASMYGYYAAEILECSTVSSFSYRQQAPSLDEIESEKVNIFNPEEVSLLGTGIHVYPNPTSGLLYVNIGNGCEEDAWQYEVYNMDGLLLKRSSVTSQNITIDMQQASEGLYILKLVYASGNTDFVKFIVKK